MSKVSLAAIADQLPRAWTSTVAGQAAGANLKVLRLDLQGQVTEVHAGEVFIVPAGVPHAEAPGSHGTLVIIDR